MREGGVQHGDEGMGGEVREGSDGIHASGGAGPAKTFPRHIFGDELRRR